MSSPLTAKPRDGRTSRERRYYLSSAFLDASRFARAVRAYWGIENRLHWVLDVVFHDDLARPRSGHGPQNMAVVKHMAMNFIRSPNDKHSLKVWRKRAILNDKYLEAPVRQKFEAFPLLPTGKQVDILHTRTDNV
jgi:hypothetical protein